MSMMMNDFEEEHANKSKSPFLGTTFNFLGLIDRHYYNLGSSYFYRIVSYHIELYCIVPKRVSRLRGVSMISRGAGSGI